MQQPAIKFPFVIIVGAVLVLGGCKSNEERAVTAFCEAFEDCQPENFAEQFDDEQQCIDESLDAIDEATKNSGDACVDAFAIAIECAADANAESCDFDNVVDKCGEEILEALDECPELELGSLDLGGLL